MAVPEGPRCCARSSEGMMRALLQLCWLEMQVPVDPVTRCRFKGLLGMALSIPMGQCRDRPFKRTPTLPKRDSKGRLSGPPIKKEKSKFCNQIGRFQLRDPYRRIEQIKLYIVLVSECLGMPLRAKTKRLKFSKM